MSYWKMFCNLTHLFICVDRFATVAFLCHVEKLRGGVLVEMSLFLTLNV